MNAVRTLRNFLQLLETELPGLIHDRIELFSLEMHRAGRAAAEVLVLALAALLLLLTTWLACCAGIAALVIELGFHWAVALAVVVLMNLLPAAWALLRARSLLPSIQMPVTRHHLTMGVGPLEPGLASTGMEVPR